jgi:hypothetical protein
MDQRRPRLVRQIGPMVECPEASSPRDAGSTEFTRIRSVSPLHELLVSEGYKVVDDSWDSQGRRTYDHNDEATREFIAGLDRRLRGLGWERDPDEIRAFCHPQTREFLEIEPGGSETSGHFIHHLKSD